MRSCSTGRPVSDVNPGGAFPLQGTWTGGGGAALVFKFTVFQGVLWNAQWVPPLEGSNIPPQTGVGATRVEALQDLADRLADAFELPLSAVVLEPLAKGEG